MTVYIAPEVADVLALHPYLTDTAFRRLPIREQLARQARTVLAAHQSGDGRIAAQVLSWWPGAQQKTADEVMAGAFDRTDAEATIAREHGFPDWVAVEALGELAPDPCFEAALDAMLDGDAQGLEALLDETPELATARSRFGHRSTLLHYLGANGVESHRQVTPLNAAEMARLLVARGASVRASADIYGGGQTPYALASTSAHPLNAGIAEELNLVLSEN